MCSSSRRVAQLAAEAGSVPPPLTLHVKLAASSHDCQSPDNAADEAGATPMCGLEPKQRRQQALVGAVPD